MQSISNIQAAKINGGGLIDGLLSVASPSSITTKIICTVSDFFFGDDPEKTEDCA